jgi:hypothetical protein
LTGLGTVIGWIASDSFLDTAFTAVRWAGAFTLTFGIAAMCIALIPLSRTDGLTAFLRWGMWLGVIPVLLLFIVGHVFWIFGDEFDEEPKWFFGWGCAGILYGLLFLVTWAAEQGMAYSDARTQCLDCAETIKSKARVCPHCGYRFKPPPTLDEQQAAKSN